jgi:MYXO-CTERM domain-containing protein
MTYAANGSAVMNVAAGFEGSVWFHYATRASAIGSIAIYDGLNGAGSLLASMTLPSTTSRQCPGGLQNVFGCWNLFEANFTGVAQSVVFAGTGLGFDNVSFNVRALATPVPEPAGPGVFGIGALLLGLFAGWRRRFQ